jgi:hypothetical protein
LRNILIKREKFRRQQPNRRLAGTRAQIKKDKLEVCRVGERASEREAFSPSEAIMASDTKTASLGLLSVQFSSLKVLPPPADGLSFCVSHIEWARGRGELAYRFILAPSLSRVVLQQKAPHKWSIHAQPLEQLLRVLFSVWAAWNHVVRSRRATGG